MNTKQYMVFVENCQRPTVIHDSYGSALQEANRLADLQTAKGRKVYILAIVAMLAPVTQPTHVLEAVDLSLLQMENL